MPDNQQRRRQTNARKNLDTPSTGRRGSHPIRESSREKKEDVVRRKRKSLYESDTPIEIGGPE